MTDALRREKSPHDVFINLDGSIEMAVQFQKAKAVALVKWLARKGVEKIQAEHQHAIEEKDAALALINDDLQDRDNHIQAIQYDNVALQAQRHVYQTQQQRYEEIITHLRVCYVDHV